MKTSQIILVLIYLTFLMSSYGQVGVNNTNPLATLDIRASSTTSPANNDGILIPRMSAFPTNPGGARDGMLIFYTGTSAFGEGFYYWIRTRGWIFLSGASNINDLTDGVNDNSSVYLGTNTGVNDDGFNSNVGIGINVLQANTSGTSNNAFGFGALGSNTIGGNNNAFGHLALFANTTGLLNTAIGSQALRFNTIGDGNTAIGSGALQNNNTGENNTALGFFAGNSSTGDGNVFLGYQAGAGATDDNELYIENSSSSDPLIYGRFDSDILRVNGILQVGNPSISGFQFPSTDGTVNQVLTTDGDGNVSFETSTAQNNSASNGLNEVGADIRLGGLLNQNTIISQGTRFFNINLNGTGDFAIQDNGTDVFFVEDTGDIGIGTNNPAHPLHIIETLNGEENAIYIDKTDNSGVNTHSIFIEKNGNGTGRSHAIYNQSQGAGSGNRYAVYNLTQGSGNGQKYGTFNQITTTAAGNQYGTRNWINGATTAQQFGVFNNMISGATGAIYGTYNGMRNNGDSAQVRGVHNEFSTAGNINEMTGVFNQMDDGRPGSVGMQGVYNDFSNTNNGDYYGVRNQYSSGATGIGNKYGTYSFIHPNAGGTHYGTFLSVDSDNDSAHIQLEENDGDDGARIRFTNAAETASNWTLYARADDTQEDSQINFFFSNAPGNNNIMQVFGDNEVRINGRLGVNFSDPTFAIQLPNNATIGTGRGRANAWTTYSDSRVKSDQQPLQNGLSIINKMLPKTYFHHNGNIDDGVLNLSDSGEQTLGFIAQELYDIFPEAVQKPEDENQALWSVNYDKVIPVAVKAIQELNTRVETLQAENKSLKQQLSKLEQLGERLLVLEKNTNN